MRSSSGSRATNGLIRSVSHSLIPIDESDSYGQRLRARHRGWCADSGMGGTEESGPFWEAAMPRFGEFAEGLLGQTMRHDPVSRYRRSGRTMTIP